MTRKLLALLAAVVLTTTLALAGCSKTETPADDSMMVEDAMMEDTSMTEEDATMDEESMEAEEVTEEETMEEAPVAE